MKNDNRKQFVTTPGGYGARIWLSSESPLDVRDFLSRNSKWQGSDKREGARVSYEMCSNTNLDRVRATLVEMGMTDYTESQEVMNDLTRWV